jgi:hypothetical protein
MGVGILEQVGTGVDRAGSASREARSMDHILVASTADTERRPSNSKDMPVPINRGRPKEATPQKQRLRKRSSFNYSPATSLDELGAKKKSPRRENLQAHVRPTKEVRKNRAPKWIIQIDARNVLDLRLFSFPQLSYNSRCLGSTGTSSRSCYEYHAPLSACSARQELKADPFISGYLITLSAR